jgi:hypothetical protein
MSGHPVHPVTTSKKVLLLVLGTAGIACLLLSATARPQATTQSPASFPIVGAQTTTPSASDSESDAANQAQLLYEQTRPRSVVPFNPEDFDKYVGFYEFESDSTAFIHVFRKEDHYFVQLTGQGPVENYPESATKFFATVVAAQFSFVTDAKGQVTGLVLHQNGLLQPAKRVADSVATIAEAALQRRIEDKIPSPGTEAALRHQIATLESGTPDYGAMGSALAQATREQLPAINRLMNKMGDLQSLVFNRVLPSGADVYLATFAHGQLECTIAPLSPAGKVVGDFYHNIPP